jgi:DNA polymerase-4
VRTIAHVDMDCFFAAVEVLDHPEYRGLPVIVGGARGGARSVVSTCSYEARAYGVHSAMPMATAERLCPDAVFVCGNMRRYVEVSNLVMSVLGNMAPIIQQVSIDEAFLDMTGCEHLYPSAYGMGEAIRQAIKDASGLTASVGIGPNKYIAKLASSSCKPNGLLVVSEGEVEAFLDPMPVSKLWGVGEQGSKELARYGITTVSELKSWSQQWMIDKFGKWGAVLYRLARGIDDDPVTPDEEPQSYASENTFETDISDIDVLRRALVHHSSRVARRLRESRMLARTVTLKIKYSDFQQITRGRSLAEPFDDDNTAYATSSSILDEINLAKPVRLIGVCLSGLTGERQLSLFAQPRASTADNVLDAIARKHGSRLVVRGRELQ